MGDKQELTSAATPRAPITAAGDVSSRAVSDDASTGGAVTDVTIYCKACDIWVSGQEQYDRHIAGKKHVRNTRCHASHSTPRTTSQEHSGPRPDEVQLLLYNIAGEEVGVVRVPSLAKWQQIAVAVVLRYSHYQAIPPENPRAVLANELDGWIHVAIKDDSREK